MALAFLRSSLNFLDKLRSCLNKLAVMIAPALIRGLWGFFSSFNEKALNLRPEGSLPTNLWIYRKKGVNINMLTPVYSLLT